jgi:membrane fusion protein (multidrug efflux system)
VPSADEQARTFPVDIELTNPDGALKPGMFARADVPAGVAREQLIVPKDAIVRGGPMGPLLYVIRSGDQGDQAVPVAPLKTGDEWRDWIGIEAPGLAAGDRVVVRGNENLRGPGPVDARPWSPARPQEPNEIRKDSAKTQAKAAP